MFPFHNSKASFFPLHRDSEDGSERDQMLDNGEYVKERNASRTRRCWSSNVPWMLITLALSVYTIASTAYYKSSTGSCSCGVTDIGPSKPYIEEVFKTMTSGLDYNGPNGTLQHTPAPGPRFVGPPSPEINAAWKNIAGVQEIYLTREEAVAASVPDTYIDPLTGLYEVEIESLHHIHCLNYIRKSFDIDDYPDIQAQADTWRLHREHCLNNIREFIMCKADFTPIVLIPPEISGIPVPLSEFRTTHVCRNFDKLLNWVQTERAADGDKETRLRHAKRIRELTGSKY